MQDLKFEVDLLIGEGFIDEAPIGKGTLYWSLVLVGPPLKKITLKMRKIKLVTTQMIMELVKITKMEIQKK